MTETSLLARFDRATTAAGAVVDGVKPEQLDDPTPCTEWTVRQLVNHVVGGTRQFISMMTGGGQLDRSQDFLGDDPSGAFRASVAELRALFAADGALEKVVQTPFGPNPAATLVGMRVNEMLLHGWDLAKATGQSTDLDPELAESCIPAFKAARAGGRGKGMFADEQPAPDDAPPADRLAAAAGRSLTWAG
jgi:uncharacterized protein (TIGR03086 family)